MCYDALDSSVVSFLSSVLLEFSCIFFLGTVVYLQ